MNKVITVTLVFFSLQALAVDLKDAAPKNCEKLGAIEGVSQDGIERSKESLKDFASNMGADTVHLLEVKPHLVTTHDLPDMTLYISKGIAYKCENP